MVIILLNITINFIYPLTNLFVAGSFLHLQYQKSFKYDIEKTEKFSENQKNWGNLSFSVI